MTQPNTIKKVDNAVKECSEEVKTNIIKGNIEQEENLFSKRNLTLIIWLNIKCVPENIN